eukprot:Colp12_sorted_trinity150504_noHs@1456
MADDWGKNPFANPNEANPFNDPAVTTHTTGTVQEYNPFGSDYMDSRTQPVRAPSNAPVYGRTSPQPRSQYDADADISAREDEVRFREEQQAYKETQARNQATRQKSEYQTNQQGLVVENKQPNWPPFPNNCIRPFKPFIYHNIDEEIPSQARGLMHRMFGLWNGLILCLVMNMIAAFARLVGCGDCDDNFLTFGLSLLFMFAFIPCSFSMWYRTLYNAMKNDKSLSFMLFFFVFAAQIIVAALNAIGVPKIGAVGWIQGFMAVDAKSLGVGIVCFISAGFWTIFGLLSLYMLKRVHEFYRTSGMSVARAQSEAVTAAANNQTVRDGMRDAILKNATQA